MSLHPDLAALTPDMGQPVAGRISLVGAGPGPADLLTGRAVARIAAADVVFFDRLVGDEVLALIPARARRVDVGKEVGGGGWSQARICAAIVTAAQAGLRVVRLKSGDPSIFGRAAEEIDAARAAGVPVEIVPGITAASAAAASLCEPLTERGRFDRLLVATGTSLTGEAVGNLAASLVPGTRLALYMAIHCAARIEADLLEAGLPGVAAVTIISKVGHAEERVARGRLAGMATLIAAQGIANPALVLIDIAAGAGVTQEAALNR
ncbi:uroporphyrin-III C-methyltransferase / precorrin-2 dehydrogenase / sirohydrochlorin ferrochelatase [Gemmobacter aquatilis]|uniref:uroporphyrinogen-III C-methyltransferase n=1 Tax=Gemmobacter aquatilis TaxID=933059 RepID=A0A1H8CBF7_9RHOB|nr:uroporphyrinogen-III C-methyltransferase [Gemmobacter aquatilis]SEM92292.1 uroporphyrin-III C-methyltransferase / precorrin-2 dehydrogenase / sirohydrochlorin ferrochelatase [Gemmobacter aquatilis]